MRAITLCCLVGLLPFPTVAADLSQEIALLGAASGVEAATPELQRAWRRVAAGDPLEMTEVLGAMGGVSTTAQNWLRTAADAMAERALSSGDGFPAERLEEFLLDDSQPPRGRRAAYEWLVKADPGAKAKYLPDLLNDPSIELRYDAVDALLQQAAADGVSEEEQKRLYGKAFASAIDRGQLEKCAERLKELGEEADIVQPMGFITSWKLIGPFDNVDGVGFDKAYPPEEQVQLDAAIKGKKSVVAWQSAEAEGALGQLDLTETLGPEKGAVAYVYCVYQSGKAQDAEVRYATPNASKLWVNGELLASNHVYHAGNPLDQYRSSVRLREGENTILVKVCQNEQTDGWAQAWELQLRVTDPLGKGLPAAE
ncbi:hypothetical protein KOR34_05660 [Posidoniimonas corsicana]|uniref:HEAT repeat protein n=1 Tax=Posidoniimonas corsicana TaxID=1938618 RepID=A0A5C5VD81_9BACT|nr:hypothetical protein [Posidoniimonas corsicana]TWT35672.1 hypothetical protein KOR34_05660 [Posidoniimonas corsicana]